MKLKNSPTDVELNHQIMEVTATVSDHRALDSPLLNRCHLFSSDTQRHDSNLSGLGPPSSLRKKWPRWTRIGPSGALNGSTARRYSLCTLLTLTATAVPLPKYFRRPSSFEYPCLRPVLTPRFWQLATDALPPQDATILAENLGIEMDTPEHMTLERGPMCTQKTLNPLKRKR